MFLHRKPARRVLVVADVPGIARQVERILAGAGFAATTAPGVVDALERTGCWPGPAGGALKWRPDLIVSDWKMADFDGTELLYIARTTPALRGVPFLLLAGKSPLYDSMGYLRGMALQPDAYLLKPFTPDELVERATGLVAAAAAASHGTQGAEGSSAPGAG